MWHGEPNILPIGTDIDVFMDPLCCEFAPAMWILLNHMLHELNGAHYAWVPGEGSKGERELL